MYSSAALAEPVPPYRVCRIGRLFAARWTRIDLPSLRRIEEEIEAFSAEHHEPVIYAPVSDDSTDVPDHRARSAMLALAEAFAPRLRSLYVVIEVNGFKGSMHRSGLAGMILLSKATRGRVHVVDSLSAVLLAEGGRGLGADPMLARAAMIRDGVWR